MQSESAASTEAPTTPESDSPERRHDVDWLRTLVLCLLIVYHVVLSFQPWAVSIRFPQNETLLRDLWIPMAMINVWRIPILFLISGMGVCFAMDHRNWKQLLQERTVRILVPFVFGTYVLGTLFRVALPHLGWDADFTFGFGHLWFLGNIYMNILWTLSILVYLRSSPDNALFSLLSRLIRRPYGLLLLALPLMIEAGLVNPRHYELYVDTLHGYLLGLICFLLGFLLISIRDAFWPAVVRIRGIALAVAFSLYATRLLVFRLSNEHNWLIAFESWCWMLAIFGFAARYLNKPSRSLDYCSKAVYPVYILHLPVQFTIAYFLLPLPLPAVTKLIVLLAGTFGVSLLLYELVLRRLKWVRPLFGMKLNQG